MFSMVKKCSWRTSDAGLLVLRIGIGALFIFAGYMKAQDMAATIGQFSSMGFSAFWTYVVTIVELVAGVAVLLGIFTRIAAALVSVVMIVALTVVWKGGMNMIMTPAITLFATVALFLSGSGRFSAMRKFCGCGECPVCVGSDVVKN